MDNPETYLSADESNEEFSERVVFEWFLPAFIGAAAVETVVFIGGVREPIEVGIGVAAFIALHKVLQKLDIFDHWRQ